MAKSKKATAKPVAKTSKKKTGLPPVDGKNIEKFKKGGPVKKK